MTLRSALRGTILALTLSPCALPAAAQTSPKLPGGAVFSFTPTSATTGTLNLVTPSGAKIPVGTLDVGAGAFAPQGLGLPNGPAKLNSSGQSTSPFNLSLSAKDGSTTALTQMYWSFAGTPGSTPGAVTSAELITTSVTGSSKAYVWPFVSNMYDAGYQPAGTPASGISEDVALVGQAVRQDVGANWQGGALPNRIWAADIPAIDLIPWGTAGYPAFPPTGSNVIGAEVDIQPLGPDRNNTRQILSLDCTPALGNTTIFTECGTILGGGDSGTKINGARQVTVHDVVNTAYQASHSILNTVNNTLPPGARDIWLGDAGKIAFSASGSRMLQGDPVTGAVQYVQNGSLGFPTVTAGGSGYTHCAATLSGGGGGPVDLTCSVTNGAVSAVNLDPTYFGPAAAGNDFTSAPTIAIAGDGTGAAGSVGIVPQVTAPVGAGLAVQDATVAFGSSFTMSAYMQGRIMAYYGAGAGTLTLPPYSAASTRNGLITLVQNRGAAPLTVVGSSGSILQYGTNNSLVLAPGDSALLLLDTDDDWRPVSITRAANGHTLSSGATPAVSGCGTSPAISGSDGAGYVTTGSGASSCTITFAQAYNARPYCNVTGESAAVTYSVSPTAITVAAGAGVNVDYSCTGQAGG